VTKLSHALIADIASIIGNWHTHNEIDIMFTRLGAPGDPPVGTKVIKVQTWLRLANEDQACDVVSLLGGIPEELMDRSVNMPLHLIEEARGKVVGLSRISSARRTSRSFGRSSTVRSPTCSRTRQPQ